MRKEVPVNIRPETNACWGRGDIGVISTEVALCGSHAFQHSFQLFVAQRCALCRKYLVSLDSPNRHSLLVLMPLIHWSALNTPKSLDTPTAKIQRIKAKGSCRPVDWASASYPLLTEGLVQVLSDRAEKMWWCPIMLEPDVLSLMKRHMFQEYW
jgi:hypothetical protein